ncbi:hypothetical protein [Mitsuaria sp. 7]|uniref:NHL domain-containing protein n=1 Tax=Mitsuaria sp. 7 TaxID=1658665 RepID=UPI0007DDAB7F|nr:hypothetical protein [Mitsuaria sp. 7]ANH67150.1 hypothetical protein ABE85_05410 [Mitsuaria sp. 7]
MFSVDWFSVERRLHAAAVAVLCALLVACGGGDDPAPVDGAAPTAPPVVTPPVVTPPVVTPPVVAPPVLTITQQPADAAVIAGAQASFVVAGTCSAGTLNIQWQRNTGADGAFVAIASATTPSYALTSAIADNGAKFRAALDCGGESATTSAAATLSVTNPVASVLSPVAVTGLRYQAPITFSRGIVRESSGSYAFVSGNAVLRLSADLQSITPIAGSVADTSGTTVDGLGAAAKFNTPYGITVDAAGNLYVTERFGYVIRRIATDGAVTTIAGAAGQLGSADGTGAAARFYLPSAIAIGPDGDLYVADRSNHLVRRVTTAGVVSTYAGSAGQAGYLDGAAGAAKFSYPSGLAVGSDGTVYVSSEDSRVRRILRNGSVAGAVQTLAGSGSGTVSPTMDGTGTAAIIVAPQQMAIAGTTLYVRDSAGLVRTIDTATAVVTTLAGTAGATVPRDGPKGAATIDSAFNGGGLTPTADGGLMLTETNLFLGAVRRIDASGVVTTLATAHPLGFNGTTPGTGVLAQLPFAWFPEDAMIDGLSHFSRAVAVAGAPDGGLVVGSIASLRRIAPGGAVSPIAGLFGFGTFDGIGSAADVVNASQAIVVDPAGVIYFSDVSTIRAVDSTRSVRTIAGTPSVFGDSSGQGQGAVDGPGATARFSNVTGLARAANGDLFASDSTNCAIRRIDPAGNVSTYAGVMGEKAATDGPRATARFTGPLDLSLSPDGSLWLLDGGRNETPTVRRVAPDGTVSSLPAKVRRLTVDPAGNIYVISEGGDLASLDPATGALTVLVPQGTRLTFGSDPRVGGDAGWAFNAVGIKQLVLMSEHQLIRATLP